MFLVSPKSKSDTKNQLWQRRVQFNDEVMKLSSKKVNSFHRNEHNSITKHNDNSRKEALKQEGYMNIYNYLKNLKKTRSKNPKKPDKKVESFHHLIKRNYPNPKGIMKRKNERQLPFIKGKKKIRKKKKERILNSKKGPRFHLFNSKPEISIEKASIRKDKEKSVGFYKKSILYENQLASFRDPVKVKSFKFNSHVSTASQIIKDPSRKLKREFDKIFKKLMKKHGKRDKESIDRSRRYMERKFMNSHKDLSRISMKKFEKNLQSFFINQNGRSFEETIPEAKLNPIKKRGRIDYRGFSKKKIKKISDGNYNRRKSIRKNPKIVLAEKKNRKKNIVKNSLGFVDNEDKVLELSLNGWETGKNGNGEYSEYVADFIN